MSDPLIVELSSAEFCQKDSDTVGATALALPAPLIFKFVNHILKIYSEADCYENTSKFATGFEYSSEKAEIKLFGRSRPYLKDNPIHGGHCP